jgi:hypothetical protein
MTNASTTSRGPAIQLSSGDGRYARAGVLVIAAGTPFSVIVRDARSIYGWAVGRDERDWDTDRLIAYHHTAGGSMKKRSDRSEVLDMVEMARASEWGLPYNFVVMPAHPWRIYYLNDVDLFYPHTWGHNHATAIAAWGNYSVDQPPPRMVERMVGLADALATMWGEWVREIQHRDVYATECPGNHLAPLLPGMYRQRGL